MVLHTLCEYFSGLGLNLSVQPSCGAIAGSSHARTAFDDGGGAHESRKSARFAAQAQVSWAKGRMEGEGELLFYALSEIEAKVSAKGKHSLHLPFV